MAQYDIFLSFSEADSAQVNLLIDRLHREIPGIKIFYDTEGNELSEFERTRIIKAIDESKLVVFAVSESSIADENCEKEVMYAKNTAKRVVPYLLPGMTLKGWLLYELGRINCVDSTKEEEISRFIETLRQKLGYSSENQADNLNADTSGTIQGSSTPITPSEATPNSIEFQLVFDERTGEFVTRQVGDTQATELLNNAGDSSDYSINANESSMEEQSKKLYLSGHEYVDLGLPSGLKWAACNLGSFRMEDSGTYYAWGETKAKAPFNQSNCQAFGKDKEWLKSNDYIDDSGNLTPSHDAAHKDWGSTWRMPTKVEIEELQSNTTSAWHRVNGIDGCKLTSKINGQSIFFPGFGRKDGYNTLDNGILGMFWSSTVSVNNDTDACRLALGLNLFSVRDTSRYMGLSIRPVSE